MSEQKFQKILIKFTTSKVETLVKSFLTDFQKTLDELAPIEGRLEQLLAELNWETYPVKVLIVLYARVAFKHDKNAIIDNLKKFLKTCSKEKIKAARYGYYELFHKFAALMVEEEDCIRGIKIIAKAIDIIRDNKNQLTPIHSDLCLLSLKSRSFRMALDYLKDDVYEIDTGMDKAPNENDTEQINYNSKFVLLYFYYGGMILTAMKDYEKAHYFFEACVSTPSLAVSRIVVEAFKKLVLVSLIAHGSYKVHTKFINAKMIKLVPEVKLYNDLILAYKKSLADLKTFLKTHEEVLIKDGNLGLAKLLVKPLLKENIKRLTTTFVTVSLEDMKKHACLSGDVVNGDQIILSMIRDKEINAKIDEKLQIATLAEVDQYATEEMFKKLHDDIAETLVLSNSIKSLDHQVSAHSEYIKAINKDKHEGDGQHNNGDRSGTASSNKNN